MILISIIGLILKYIYLRGEHIFANFDFLNYIILEI